MQSIIYFLFKLLQPFFPKDTYFTWDEIINISAEPIDGWTMFQWLKKNRYRAKYVIRRQSPFYKKLKKNHNIDGIIAIENPNKSLFQNCFWQMLRARATIKPFLYGGGYRNFFTDKKLKENKYIHDVYLDHGIIYFKEFAAKMYNPNLSEILVISNDYEKDIYRHISNWPVAQMKRGGLARWENLKRENAPDEKKRIFLYFTWRGSLDLFHFWNRRKWQHDYHPGKSVYVEKIQSLLGNPKLEKICKKYNIQLELGVHHAQIDSVGLNMFCFYNKNARLVDMTDISNHIKTADMMITDRSSIIFDPMFLDIPIAFYTPDKDDLMLNKDEHKDEEIAIKLQKETMYNYCETEDILIKTIEHYAKNGFILENENKKINDTFFYFRKDICKNIMKATK